MANSNPKPPPAHSRFKKGQSGNPEGGRAHDPVTKAIKRLTRKELAEAGSVILGKSLEQLKEIRTNPKSKAIEAIMAGMAIKMITRGDAAAFDAVFNRIVGKVKEEISTVNTNINTSLEPEDREMMKDIMRELDDEI